MRCILFFCSCLVLIASVEIRANMMFNKVDQLGAGHAPIPIVPTAPKKIKNIKLKKDKGGNFLVDWRIFAEYDIPKKKPGKNLKKIIGKKISIKGFMLPLEYSKRQVKEFLLIPYFPSCYHVPPPPPNMVINVNIKSKKGAKVSYYPVTVKGKLSMAKKSKANPFMLDGAFSMKAVSVKENRN